MDAGGAATFARAQQLIEAVPAWAAALSRPESPVFVADLWTNSDVAQTLDGVHPDDDLLDAWVIDGEDAGLRTRVGDEVGARVAVTDTVMRDDEVAEHVARTALATLT